MKSNDLFLSNLSKSTMALALSQRKWPKDSPYSSLPHPVATEASLWHESFATLLGHLPDAANLLNTALANPGWNVSKGVAWEVNQMLLQSPQDQMRAVGLITGDKMQFAAADYCANQAFRARTGAIIETTPALDRMLQDSDISADLPVRFFAAPYKSNYVHFGRPVAIEGGDHKGKVVGVYVFFNETIAILGEGTPNDGHFMHPESAALWGIKEGEKAKYIEFTAVIHSASVDGGVNVRFLSTWVYMPSDSDMSIERVLAESQGTAGMMDTIRPILAHVAKVFLYMGLTDMRSERVDELARAKKSVDALGPKKRGKAERKLRLLYDRIVVGPVHDIDHGAGVGSSDGQTRPHMRRGHFRSQRYGSGNLLQKIIFIAPVLVRADLVEAASPEPKRYLVKH